MGKPKGKAQRDHSKTTKSNKCQKEKESGISSNTPIGLMNIGQSCYLNSTLQGISASLYHMKPLPKCEEGVVSQKLVEVLSLMRDSLTTVNPSLLLTAVSRKYAQFRERCQHDAHDIYLALLSGLKEESEKNASISKEIHNIFEGVVVSNVRCLHCFAETRRFEYFFDLSVSIPSINESKELKSKQGDKRNSSVEKIRRRRRSENLLSESESTNNDDSLDDQKNDIVEHTQINNKVFDIACDLDAIRDNKIYNCAPVSALDSFSEDGPSVSPTIDPFYSPDPPNKIASNNNNNNDDDANNDTGMEHGVDVNNICLQVASINIKENSKSKRSQIFDVTYPSHCDRSVFNQKLHIFSCLSGFVSPEKLKVSDGNGFMCESCNGIRDAEKIIFPISMPRVLVIHLKRLMPQGKIRSVVDFPLELDMSGHVGNVDLADTQFAEKKVNGVDINDILGSNHKKKHDHIRRYQLAAVVCHSGSSYGGHYSSYIKYQDHWYFISDQTVTLTSQQAVLKAEAYMLFYTTI